MTADTLLEILELEGADSPAFLALYNQVVRTLSPTERDRLAAAVQS